MSQSLKLEIVLDLFPKATNPLTLTEIKHNEVNLPPFQNKTILNIFNVFFFFFFSSVRVTDHRHMLPSLYSFHPRRFSKAVYTMLWALCSKWSSFSRWGGQDNLQRPIPIWIILWLNDKLHFLLQSASYFLSKFSGSICVSHWAMTTNAEL